jgi:guanylate kinase
MPVVMDDTGIAAFDFLCDSINSAEFDRAVGAQPNDVAFLCDVFNQPIFAEIVQAYDTLEDAHKMNPVSCDNINLVKDIVDELGENSGRNTIAKELRLILRSPHFQSLIEAHDDVASKNYEVIPVDAYPLVASPLPMTPVTPNLMTMPFNSSQNLTQDAVRMVGVRKNQDESLGITVRSCDGGLTIARILPASVIEKQGLLHVGDIIKEINGQEVTNPDQLQEIMKKASGTITFKIIPTSQDQNASVKVYLKAHFTYDPKRDNLIPCREAGLPFRNGEILEVVNRDDPNWWQARRVDVTTVDPRMLLELSMSEDNRPSTGVIPSQLLEEKRKAFVRPEFDYTHKSLLCGITTKKKRKMLYAVNSCSDLDRTDLLIYEEVARMPPFQRKTLILLGAKGVGRRTLKSRLIKADPDRFATIVPYTTREKRVGETDGDMYYFISQEQMVKDIANNQFMEYGQYDGCYYGTKFESIREVIRGGRMCILDISPQAAKSIKTSEFMPYIVFLAAPPVEIQRNMYEFARLKGKTDKLKGENDFRSTFDESARIERQYKQYFDETIVNDNIDETYNKLRRAIEKLSTKHQWVPVTWVY